MRKVMTLTGLPVTLVTALQSGQIPATHLLGVKKSSVVDGQFEVVYVDRDVKLDAKLDIEVPPGLYGQNHVIALKGVDDTVQGHFLVENAAMPIEDANAIANILVEGAYDKSGNVRGAKDGMILMPAIVDADRARIRLADGQFLDVDTSDLSGNPKLTASLIDRRDGKSPVLVIGAEDDNAVFVKPVLEYLAEARNGRVESLGDIAELTDGSLKRIARAKGDEIAIDTDKGVFKAKINETGKLELGEVKAHMAEDVDTLGDWDNVGESEAITDQGGNPVRAYAQPGTNGALKLAFLPIKAAPATEVQA